MTSYRVTEFTLDGIERLLRVLSNQPAEVDPVLGQVPVLDTRAPTLSAAAVGSAWPPLALASWILRLARLNFRSRPSCASCCRIS